MVEAYLEALEKKYFLMEGGGRREEAFVFDVASGLGAEEQRALPAPSSACLRPTLFIFLSSSFFDRPRLRPLQPRRGPPTPPRSPTAPARHALACLSFSPPLSFAKCRPPAAAAAAWRLLLCCSLRRHSSPSRARPSSLASAPAAPFWRCKVTISPSVRMEVVQDTVNIASRVVMGGNASARCAERARDGGHQHFLDALSLKAVSQSFFEWLSRSLFLLPTPPFSLSAATTKSLLRPFPRA